MLYTKYAKITISKPIPKGDVAKINSTKLKLSLKSV